MRLLKLLLILSPLFLYGVEDSCEKSTNSASLEKRFKCKYNKCKYTTNHLGSFKSHIMIHTDKRPFKCNYPNCNYDSKRAYGLARHKISHKSKKTFKCDHHNCNFASKTSEHLKRHKMIHTRKKLFKCNYPNCNYTSKRSDGLKRHKMLHTGENSLKCNHYGCHFASNDSSNLKRHIKNMHSIDNAYKCHLCSFTFSSNIKLTNHLKKHDLDTPNDLLDLIPKKLDEPNPKDIINKELDITLEVNPDPILYPETITLDYEIALGLDRDEEFDDQINLDYNKSEFYDI